MNTDFDFDNIGKRTPYRTPEGLFDEVQRNVMRQTCGKQRPKRKVVMIITTAMAMAAVFVGLLFIPTFYQQSEGVVSANGDVLAIEKHTVATGEHATDKWIKDLSDEELEELVNFSENDLFLN